MRTNPRTFANLNIRTYDTPRSYLYVFCNTSSWINNSCLMNHHINLFLFSHLTSLLSKLTHHLRKLYLQASKFHVFAITVLLPSAIDHPVSPHDENVRFQFLQI